MTDRLKTIWALGIEALRFRTITFAMLLCYLNMCVPKAGEKFGFVHSFFYVDTYFVHFKQVPAHWLSDRCTSQVAVP